MPILLLRHGDAIEHGYIDAQRPLSLLGEEQAMLAGMALQQFEISVDMILSSPLERAKQTAMAVQRALQIPEVVTTEYLAPGGDQRKIVEFLNELSKVTVLLVGHEPLLSTIISSLTGASMSTRIIMSKGSLACLDTRSPIEPGSCTLRWLITTEQMKKLPGYSSGGNG